MTEHTKTDGLSAQVPVAATEGDEGARSVIQRYRDKAQWIQTQDAGVMADIDVPADLQKPGLKVKE